MKCPRCNQEVSKTALYCLNCGKQLKADGAFGEEFEDGFHYDEELPSLERRAPPTGKRRLLFASFFFGILFLISSVFLVLDLTGVLNLSDALSLNAQSTSGTEKEDEGNSLSPGEAINSDSSSQSEQALSDQDLIEINSLLTKLIVAGSTTYDLESILQSAPPQARSRILSVLMEDFGCQTQEELQERFANEAITNSYVFSNLSFEPNSLCSREEINQKESSILLNHGLKLDPIEKMLSVTVYYSVVHLGERYDHQIMSYTVGKLNGAWYCLDF